MLMQRLTAATTLDAAYDWLRRAVGVVNGELTALALEKHPDKTFIGRIDRGFDFLGYRFDPTGLQVAKSTVRRFAARAARLYEQERRRPHGPDMLGPYLRRWTAWAQGGLWEAASGDRALGSGPTATRLGEPKGGEDCPA